MEIIEIGAVMFRPRSGFVAEFQTFVRPGLSPVLSEFCQELTHIRQADVDNAPSFPEALNAMLKWSSPFAPFVWASWGNYDRRQLQADCARYGIVTPVSAHVNLKTMFAQTMGRRRCGMAEALKRLQLPLLGTHHRGIDDVRNIARIVETLWPNGVPVTP